MNAILFRLGGGLARLLRGPERVETEVGHDGPRGELRVPSGGDGVWRIVHRDNRPCLAPDDTSYYLYFTLPERFRHRATSSLWVEVEYYGSRYGEFRLQYASTTRDAPVDGLYAPAEQRWAPDGAGSEHFRRAVFTLPDFDPTRTQHHGASFRLEFRSRMLVSRVVVGREPPADLASFPAVAPLPDLKKLPGRFYPIDYLFVEITNACNFKCTWCPDEIMDRRRGFMKREKVFRLLDEVAEKQSWLGPLFPVKLHQMGEPMLHPHLAEIVEHAETRGVAIELNTNCGHITRERIDGLYRAGLTNLILSYQTPDPASFMTRKAPRLLFDEYRDKVRLAVERKVALGARTILEIDIMNTKHVDDQRIVSEEEQALAFLEDWITFARELEERHHLVPRFHDWDRIRSARFLDQDENGSRYTLLDGVHLIWKRCHSWGNVIGGDGQRAEVPLSVLPSPDAGASVEDTYCPAPYDQFVIQWNGDVVSCCTDYEGRTKTANVFASSIEDVWKGEVGRRRKQDMLEGRLLDVCARCQGLK
ncbi:MAG: radical SAM protein [Acidobacteria bacterium]|nr:radical SAM protein [Acidobacteriota bacterium]